MELRSGVELERLQIRWDALLSALQELKAEACQAKGEALAAKAEARSAQEEVEMLQEAGCKLQTAYASLQQELREAAGDAAYWRVLNEEMQKESLTTPNAKVDGKSRCARSTQGENERESPRSPVEPWASVRSAAQVDAAEAANSEAVHWRQLAERRGEEIQRLRQQLLVSEAKQSASGSTKVNRALNPLFESPTPARAGLGRQKVRSTQYFDIGSPHAGKKNAKASSESGKTAKPSAAGPVSGHGCHTARAAATGQRLAGGQSSRKEDVKPSRGPLSAMIVAR